MTEDERKAFDDWWNAPYGNYSVRCEFPLNETDAAWMAWQAQAEEITRLRTALADREAKLATARNDALEEAAIFMETWAYGVGAHAAECIRALKGKT
jgi:hypothetical protein